MGMGGFMSQSESGSGRTVGRPGSELTADYVPVTHAVDVVIKGGWITRCGVFADVPERLSDDPSCRRCRGCGRPTALTPGPVQHCGDPGVPLCPICQRAACTDGRGDV